MRHPCNITCANNFYLKCCEHVYMFMYYEYNYNQKNHTVSFLFPRDQGCK